MSPRFGGGDASLERLSEDSELPEQEPQDDEDNDDAEAAAAATEFFSAVAGGEAAKEFAHRCSSDQKMYQGGLRDADLRVNTVSQDSYRERNSSVPDQSEDRRSAAASS